ncbi:hypothetical protein V3C99_018075 [Haemonchus contortus]|uniref:Clr5 domain-containing protein n=1 Tax=Haemonchus contortus TaxID=6289 RepID=A0A7I4Z687_HAECO
MRHQRRRRRKCPHRSVRKLDHPNQKFAFKKKWFNRSSNNLPQIRTSIKLRRSELETSYIDLVRFYIEDQRLSSRPSSVSSVISTPSLAPEDRLRVPDRTYWTLESADVQFHDKIYHIFNGEFCLSDIAVLLKIHTGSEYRLLRARFCFSVRGKRRMKFLERIPRDPSVRTTSLPSRVNGRIPEYNRLIKQVIQMTGTLLATRNRPVE